MQSMPFCVLFSFCSFQVAVGLGSTFWSPKVQLRQDGASNLHWYLEQRLLLLRQPQERHFRRIGCDGTGELEPTTQPCRFMPSSRSSTPRGEQAARCITIVRVCLLACGIYKVSFVDKVTSILLSAKQKTDQCLLSPKATVGLCVDWLETIVLFLKNITRRPLVRADQIATR